jgi:antagonist of KipI
MNLRVLRPGVLTTVQDLGRPGLQHLAIVPGGAMDDVAHRIANALVGNAGDMATLEFALTGPDLVADCDLLLALYGARCDARLDGAPMPCARPVLARAGARLQIGRAVEGAFGYLAVAGGIAAPVVLGARSTYLPGGFGGLDGRALAAGTELPLAADAPERAAVRFTHVARRHNAVPVGSAGTSVHWLAPSLTLPATEPLVIRVIDGVHAELFDDGSRRALVAERWKVAAESNRMGYRLSGPRLALTDAREIASQPVARGTVQVPAGGQPIVLMADRQTTGGYPRIAEVIAADVARMAQAVPGHAALRFERVTLDEADAARGDMARRQRNLVDRLRWEFGDEVH